MKMLHIVFLILTLSLIVGCGQKQATTTGTAAADDGVGSAIDDIDQLDSDLNMTELDQIDADLGNLTY